MNSIIAGKVASYAAGLAALKHENRLPREPPAESQAAHRD